MNPRYQRGDRIRIAFPFDTKADAPPAATVYGPTNAVVLTCPIPMFWRGPQRVYELGMEVKPGADLGTYRASIAYTIAGVPGTAEKSFDLIPGGDSGGAIISLYHYDRPEGRFCLAQLSSGRLVQGRNPHL